MTDRGTKDGPSGHPRSVAASGASVQSSQDVTRKVFDKDGDLTLIVAATHHMKVDSRAISRASPVFSDMLQEGSVIRKPSVGAWDIYLPDDNARGVEIIMDWIHCQHRILPRFSIDEKISVLMLIEKYKMIEILRLVARDWTIELQGEVKDLPSVPLDQLLFLAWGLGCTKLFAYVATKMAKQCRANGKGELLDEHADKLEEKEHVVVMKITDALKACRLKLLDIIRVECQQLSTKLRRTHKCCQFDGSPSFDMQNCCYMHLGFIETNSSRSDIVGLFNRAGADCWKRHSVGELKNILRDWRLSIRKHQLGEESKTPRTQVHGVRWHRKCNLMEPLIKQIFKKFDKVRLPVTRWHLVQMKQRAEILSRESDGAAPQDK